MNYNIQYFTENEYDIGAEIFLQYLILPVENDTQSINHYTISTEPNIAYTINENVYGFTIITFLNLKDTLAFKLTLNASIEKKKIEHTFTSVLSAEDEMRIVESYGYQKNNFFFIQPSKFTTLDKRRLEAIQKGDNETCMDFCIRLNEYVHNSLEYKSFTTDTTTTGEGALKIGKGVCQDYSHIYIGLCRNSGMACRYVSGYLFVEHDEPAQLHAWVEVMVPKLGWVGFDPTNNLLVHEKYFKIAHGVDYTECASVNGVVKNTKTNFTKYSITIQEQQQNQ